MIHVKIILIFSIAFITGKLISRINMPAILAWLMTGMLFGPHLLGIVSFNLMEGSTYRIILIISECIVGVLFGSFLCGSPKSTDAKGDGFGKTAIIITLCESLGTYLFVSIVFLILFQYMEIPIYLAFIFGGIALATAPAPSLAIVQQYNTKGPLSRTLVSVAILDDGVALLLFSTSMMIISSILGIELSAKAPGIPMLLGNILPYGAAVLLGNITAKIIKKIKAIRWATAVLLLCIAGFLGSTTILNILFLQTLSSSYLFISFVGTLSLIHAGDREQVSGIFKKLNPLLSAGMIVMILNLGMPLDFRLITSAGVFTVVYITARAAGKIASAAFGAYVCRSPLEVRKYLGLTLLPHSGVSLIFTGIAVAMLNPISQESVELLQGTIAAAAIVNEIIAVVLARSAFQWAGEITKPDQSKIKQEIRASSYV